MYPEGAQRLVRRDWSAIGLDHLKGPRDSWTPQMIGDALNGMGVGLQQLMEEMSLLLGSRGIAVEHGYPVKLQDTLPAGATDAVLDISNYPIPPETNADAVDGITNGYALLVRDGVSCFRGPVCFDGQVEGLAANGAAVCWGKATADYTLGAVGWNSTVPVNVVTDRGGGTTTGDTATVYLNRTDLQDPNVRQDDVIAFVMDENGLAFALDSMFDQKIGSVRFEFGITSPAGPPDYTAAAGYRGWRIADGTNGTQDLGGQVLYGYKAGGDFATVTGDIALAFTGSVTDDAVVAAISDHAAHNHTVARSDVNASFTIDDELSGVAASGTFQVDNDTATGGDPSAISSITDGALGLGHGHDTTAVGGTFDTGNSSAQSHTASGSDAAVTATVIRPTGQVALILQRIS